MRKGMLSLSLPGMRRGKSKRKTEDGEQPAEYKTAAREEPKAETKVEKPLVQTIKVPKQVQPASGTRRKNFLGGSRKPRGKQ